MAPPVLPTCLCWTTMSEEIAISGADRFSRIAERLSRALFQERGQCCSFFDQETLCRWFHGYSCAGAITVISHAAPILHWSRLGIRGCLGRCSSMCPSKRRYPQCGSPCPQRSTTHGNRQSPRHRQQSQALGHVEEAQYQEEHSHLQQDRPDGDPGDQSVVQARGPHGAHCGQRCGPGFPKL